MVRALSRNTVAVLVLGALALAQGCRERDPDIDRPLALMAPLAVGGTLLYVEQTHARAFVLDLTVDGAPVRAVPVGASPVVVEARNGRAEALVLSRGSRGDTRSDPEPGTLTAIPAAAGSDVRRYEVRSPFNAMAQTPDGRFAFVHFRPEGAQGRLLYNPNEVAIVDLEAPPGAGNPLGRTVRSFGGVPNGVVFSPPLEIRGERRVIATVLSDSYVTLMDMAHTDRPEITVRLTLPEDPRAIAPTQVLFDEERPTIYLRGSNSNDVYVLQLVENAAPAAGSNDFGVTINQLAAGVRPTDMALFGTGDARRLLVVSPGSRDARVIDARSNTNVVVPLDAAADRVLLYTGPSPRDPRAAPRALLYATDSATRAVSFVDLTDIEERRGRNVETLQLSRPIVAALPLPERNAVMLQHPPDAAAAGSLSVLDLFQRTAAPIFAEVSLQGAAFDADRQTLWVAPQGSSRIGYVDLATLHPGEVRLDFPVSEVVALTGDPMGRSRVAAVHTGSEGFITVLDSRAPSRETAVSFRAFVLTDILESVAP